MFAEFRQRRDGNIAVTNQWHAFGRMDEFGFVKPNRKSTFLPRGILRG